jgi:hypothetical protein
MQMRFGAKQVGSSLIENVDKWSVCADKLANWARL